MAPHQTKSEPPLVIHIDMDDLPRGVLSIILSKLPAKSILRFRAVCKFWLEIIDDPSFRRTVEAKECMVLGFFQEYKEMAPTIYSMTSEGQRVEAKEIVSVDEFRDYSFRNCCNGLFYLDKYDRSGQLHSVVINPFTREAIIPPEAPRWSRYGSGHRALGFDHSTGTFKLVELFFEDLKTNNLGVATFNFQTRSWARCNAPRCRSRSITPHHIHATDAGTLYWHTGNNCIYYPGLDSPKRWPDGSYGQVILSFDMEKEELRSIWFPKRVYFMHITELDGRLAVCSYGVKYINIYELVDYQSQNWVRRSRVPKPPPETSVDLSSYSKTKILVAYPLSKNVNRTKQFYLYDVENGTWTSLGEGRFNRSIQVYCVKPCLKSLLPS